MGQGAITYLKNLIFMSQAIQFEETLPESGRFLQDTSHDVHLAAAIAESPEVIQIGSEKVSVQLVENLVHHKRCHNAQ